MRGKTDPDVDEEGYPLLSDREYLEAQFDAVRRLKRKLWMEFLLQDALAMLAAWRWPIALILTALIIAWALK